MEARHFDSGQTLSGGFRAKRESKMKEMLGDTTTILVSLCSVRSEHCAARFFGWIRVSRSNLEIIFDIRIFCIRKDKRYYKIFLNSWISFLRLAIKDVEKQ